MNTEGSLDWFDGNQDALDLFRAFVEVAHVWDDLIDADKEIDKDKINLVFYLCLYTIPKNPVYRAFQSELLPIIQNGIVGYLVANEYEKSGDWHGIELAHTLRYAIADAFMYLIVQFNGVSKSIPILKDAIKVMMNERFDEYWKEHCHEQG